MKTIVKTCHICDVETYDYDERMETKHGETLCFECADETSINGFYFFTRQHAHFEEGERCKIIYLNKKQVKIIAVTFDFEKIIGMDSYIMLKSLKWLKKEVL